MLPLRECPRLSSAPALPRLREVWLQALLWQNSAAGIDTAQNHHDPLTYGLLQGIAEGADFHLKKKSLCCIGALFLFFYPFATSLSLNYLSFT